MSRFTSEELYVLASLMGLEFIIGVEDRTLENNRSGLEGLFRKNYQELEERGVFEYKIDGTLLVERDVRKSINVLNKSDQVLVVITDINGIREKINYLKYGNDYCKLTDKGSSYNLEIIDKFDIDSILSLYSIRVSDNQIKNLSLPVDSLKEISNLYNSFDENEAELMLSELIQDDGIKNDIRECLTKKNESFVLKEYKRIGNHMVNTENLILRFTDQYILSFSVADGKTVDVSIYQKEK